MPHELRRLFDLTIYLDEDADIRLLRRMQRDIAERGRTIESVARQYLEQVRPMHVQFVEPTKSRSDIVIDPGQELKHIIDRLTARIRKATDHG